MTSDTPDERGKQTQPRLLIGVGALAAVIFLDIVARFGPGFERPTCYDGHIYP